MERLLRPVSLLRPQDHPQVRGYRVRPLLEPSVKKSSSLQSKQPLTFRWHRVAKPARRIATPSCRASNEQEEANVEQDTGVGRSFIEGSLWFLAGVYVFWLFLLPYAPGDPVWAIKLETVSFLFDVSLNFFYILPILNKFGVNLLESPLVHPTAEALFNLVIAWTLMFAPLLFTDKRRNRYKGSLVLLWVVQMFLTNTVLIPYMAIRLKQDKEWQTNLKSEPCAVEEVITSGAQVVALVGGAICFLSVVWFFYGRVDEAFGSFSDRWTFFVEYVKNDRVGYAFIWDICLYSLFQPWLIFDNLSNVERGKMEVVKALRFIPCVGMVAYLWGLGKSKVEDIA